MRKIRSVFFRQSIIAICGKRQHIRFVLVLIKQKTPAIFLAEKRKENPNLFFENRQEGFFVIYHSRLSHAFLHFDLDFSGNYANIAAGIQDFMMY